MWIKVSNGLPTKAEVLQISRRLGASNNEVVGALIKVWAWADEQTSDGRVRGAVLVDVDRVGELPGLADAMVQCGWLRIDPVENPVGLLFINFQRHMGASAKARALAALRSSKHRNAR